MTRLWKTLCPAAAFLALAAACQRNPLPQAEDNARVTAATLEEEILTDLNIYLFDPATGRLLDQRYTINPKEEISLPDLPAGTMVRLAAIGNAGEMRLGSSSTYDDLMQLEFPVDSLGAARLHAQGSWILASDRTNAGSIRTAGDLNVELQPLAAQLGVRVDATALTQWSVELRDVRLVCPEGTFYPWARTYAAMGGTFPQVPTSKEFTALQNALSSRERTPSVVFRIADDDPERTRAQLQVRATLRSRSGGPVLTRVWTADISDCLPIDWTSGRNLSATLFLTDSSAGPLGQWSLRCQDDKTTVTTRSTAQVTFRLENPTKASTQISRTAVFLFPDETKNAEGFGSTSWRASQYAVSDGEAVTLGISPLQDAPWYIAVVNPTDGILDYLQAAGGGSIPAASVASHATGEDPEHPVMWACGRVDISSGTDIVQTVYPRRALCRIRVGSIRNALRDDSRPLTINRIYLLNTPVFFYPHPAAGNWNPDTAFTTARFYRTSADFVPGDALWPDTDGTLGIREQAPSYQMAEPGESVAHGQAYTPSVSLYAYPNPTVSDVRSSLSSLRSWPLLEGNWRERHTRLVIEVLLGGQLYYYPATLPVMLPGRDYYFDEIRLVNSGSTSPDIDASFITMEYDLLIRGWDYSATVESI